MGYNYSENSSSKNFWPDDTEDTFYVESFFNFNTLQNFIEKVQSKWPGVSFDDITISSEYIQTSSLGYDCYDSSDYTCFIVFTKKIV